MIKKINELKKKKNAVILVHNYQRPEIYEIADFIGDSYGLSVNAAKSNADLIIFCGVKFMAETAAILSPDKKIILPAINAGCPMADMVTSENIKDLRKKYPKAAVVSYMNTTAETKAESDVICTSSNAVKIVNSLPNDQVIFVPDKNLGSYVDEQTDKEIIRWEGFCYVHNKFCHQKLKDAKKNLKNAEVIVHPECPKKVRQMANHICSTSGMVDYAKKSKAKEFIIGTEIGMLEMLNREVPDKKFYAAPPGSTCINMKKNTLELVYKSLKEEKPLITVPEETRLKAKKALDRMLEVGK
ncbi:MAG: quinolinate synthase NadA [Nanoarchaeota archaeon]|nr:quinolinate synthase NadA [Nanoarchaeota archaeon]